MKENKKNWRGVPGIAVIDHGDSDSELEYNGQTRNYWDVEDNFYSFYKELKNANDKDWLSKPQKYKFNGSDKDFSKFCQGHADDIYDCFKESRKVNASKQIEENRKIRKWPLNETEKDYKKNKEGFMNLFEQIYNDNQDVEEVAFKCVSNALGPDLLKAVAVITHDKL
jgi:hypothetical protein